MKEKQSHLMPGTPHQYPSFTKTGKALMTTLRVLGAESHGQVQSALELAYSVGQHSSVTSVDRCKPNWLMIS
jgi:hypothetical protein